MAMGQKENPNRGPRPVDESIFPFPKPFFFRYPVFLTHSQIDKTIGWPGNHPPKVRYWLVLTHSLM